MSEQTKWMDRLVACTGWTEAKKEGEAMALGAVSFELPALLLSDPSCSPLTLWPIETLVVAPLARFAALLSNSGVDEEALGRSALGKDWERTEIIDFDGLDARWASWQVENAKKPSLMRSWSSVHPFLGVGMMCRNSANYMAAGLGELVSLDPLRGAREAMMLMKFKAKPVSESNFGLAFSTAISFMERELGPLPLYHQTAGSQKCPPGWTRPAEISRDWPSGVDFWVGAGRAQSLAQELSAECGQNHQVGRKLGL